MQLSFKIVNLRYPAGFNSSVCVHIYIYIYIHMYIIAKLRYPAKKKAPSWWT